MPIVKCTLEDCHRMAILNKQLIEDEKHDNLMNEAQLEQRMKGFLHGGVLGLYTMQLFYPFSVILEQKTDCQIDLS